MDNVDKKIEEMKSRTKGAYLTQGVSFNKNSPRQMELLKFALEQSDSFSGLIKELLAKMLDNGGIHHNGGANFSPQQQYSKPKNKDVGNFL